MKKSNLFGSIGISLAVLMLTGVGYAETAKLFDFVVPNPTNGVDACAPQVTVVDGNENEHPGCIQIETTVMTNISGDCVKDTTVNPNPTYSDWICNGAKGDTGAKGGSCAIKPIEREEGDTFTTIEIRCDGEESTSIRINDGAKGDTGQAGAGIKYQGDLATCQDAYNLIVNSHSSYTQGDAWYVKETSLLCIYNGENDSFDDHCGKNCIQWKGDKGDPGNPGTPGKPGCSTRTEDLGNGIKRIHQRKMVGSSCKDDADNYVDISEPCPTDVTEVNGQKRVYQQQRNANGVCEHIVDDFVEILDGCSSRVGVDANGKKKVYQQQRNANGQCVDVENGSVEILDGCPARVTEENGQKRVYQQQRNANGVCEDVGNNYIDINDGQNGCGWTASTESIKDGNNVETGQRITLTDTCNSSNTKTITVNHGAKGNDGCASTVETERCGPNEAGGVCEAGSAKTGMKTIVKNCQNVVTDTTVTFDGDAADINSIVTQMEGQGFLTSDTLGSALASNNVVTTDSLEQEGFLKQTDLSGYVTESTITSQYLQNKLGNTYLTANTLPDNVVTTTNGKLPDSVLNATGVITTGNLSTNNIVTTSDLSTYVQSGNLRTALETEMGGQKLLITQSSDGLEGAVASLLTSIAGVSCDANGENCKKNGSDVDLPSAAMGQLANAFNNATTSARSIN